MLGADLRNIAAKAEDETSVADPFEDSKFIFMIRDHEFNHFKPVKKKMRFALIN